MTWEEIQGKWWHRLAIALRFLIPLLGAFTVERGDEPVFVAFWLFVGSWGAYRLILWIAFGKITWKRKVHRKPLTLGNWIFVGFLVSFGPALFLPTWDRFFSGFVNFLLWTLLIAIGFTVRGVWRKVFPPPEKFVLGTCSKCEGSIEFPERGTGETIQCPHCSDNTILVETVETVRT